MMHQYSNTVKAIQCEYKGQEYDCLQEAKYVIQIENEYSYIREPVMIFYDKKTLMPIGNLGQHPPHYIPDLLIRRWEDHRAFLIEIKDDKDKHSEKVGRSEQIARNYIEYFRLDWEYKVIFYSEIQSAMSKEQIIIFMEEVRHKTDLYNFKRKFEKLDNKFRRSGRGSHKRGYPCLIQGKEVPDKEYRLYVKTGKLPSEFK